MAYIAFAVIGVVVVLVALGLVQGQRLRKTPFRKALASIVSKTASRRGKVFDVFVSYKSEDSVVARQLAEALVAVGATPWFAEYIIPIHDRRRFQRAIDLGVQNSRFGLCLTGSRYFKSQHCQNELEQLKTASDGLFALEVDAVQGLAAKAPWMQVFRLDGISGAIANLVQRLHIQSFDVSRVAHEPRRQTFVGPTKSYSIDFGDWEVSLSRKSDAGDGDVWGPEFRRWFGSCLFWGQLVVGPQDPRLRRTPMREGDHDEREYFEAALTFADRFFTVNLRQECVGVHLLFLEGWSHVALTTFFRNTWSRIYSVVLPNVDGGPDEEYAFFFYAREPFPEFCRNAHAMDELVLSLRVTHDSGRHR